MRDANGSKQLPKHLTRRDANAAAVRILPRIGRSYQLPLLTKPNVSEAGANARELALPRAAFVVRKL